MELRFCDVPFVVVFGIYFVSKNLLLFCILFPFCTLFPPFFFPLSLNRIANFFFIFPSFLHPFFIIGSLCFFKLLPERKMDTLFIYYFFLF